MNSQVLCIVLRTHHCSYIVCLSSPLYWISGCFTKLGHHVKIPPKDEGSSDKNKKRYLLTALELSQAPCTEQHTLISLAHVALTQLF